jgi:glycosyltransferase involved in cell wall biosynthesis
MSQITAILNVHNEGILAHASLLSVLAAKRVAEAKGISVEVLVTADCPSETTRAYLSTAMGLGAQVLEVSVHDLGLARNAAVAASSSRFVSFIDGDDLWSRNWLVTAHKMVENSPGTIWHPEANLYFGAGAAAFWMLHHEMDDFAGDWVSLGLRNHWTSLCFAAREILLKIPYRAVDLKAGLGYEDWSWNAEIVARGYLHGVVAGTVHFIRMRHNSLVRQTAAANALMTPTTLFRQRIGWGMDRY